MASAMDSKDSAMGPINSTRDSVMVPVSDTGSDSVVNTTVNEERADMTKVTKAAVRVPSELIDRLREELGMNGASLTNLVRAAMGIAIGLSRDESLRRYGRVQGSRSGIIEPAESYSIRIGSADDDLP